MSANHIHERNYIGYTKISSKHAFLSRFTLILYEKLTLQPLFTSLRSTCHFFSTESFNLTQYVVFRCIEHADTPAREAGSPTTAEVRRASVASSHVTSRFTAGRSEPRMRSRDPAGGKINITIHSIGTSYAVHGWYLLLVYVHLIGILCNLQALGHL